MDRLGAMRIVVAVADDKGLAPAAKRLGLSPPAVTRAVRALETRLGTRLFNRTTRVVRLTAQGAGYVAECRRILADIDDLEAAAAGAHTDLRGQICMTAPSMFGRMHVAPIMMAFLAKHPSITARMLLIDRVVDLIEEGLDVAIRIADLPDSSLSALRVGAVRRVVCAAPSFLAAHGIPRTPDDLKSLPVIDFSFATPQQSWSFPAAGKTRVIRPPGRIVANTAEVAIAAAVAGHGLARLLSYQVQEELRYGRLEIILANHEPPPVPVHVVHVEGRKASARIRAFVDLAATSLHEALALIDRDMQA